MYLNMSFNLKGIHFSINLSFFLKQLLMNDSQEMLLHTVNDTIHYHNATTQVSVYNDFGHIKKFLYSVMMDILDAGQAVG